MAQISYGTITITDTNDIESITVEYARNQSTSSAPDSGWSTIRPTWAEGYYIWQRSRIHKSGTLEEEDEFGTAVCITGSKGDDGRGLTNTETKYTNVAEGTTKAQIEALQDNAWVSEVPSYDSSLPDYWVRIKNTYDKAPLTEYIYYKDNATSNALATAALANSIATHSNENAQGAISQAASNVNEVKRIWYAQAAATPVPNAPTTGVTTSAAHDAWSITKPAADESYQYYFYCDQTKTGGGVYSWSEVILDTSTLSQYQIGAMSAKVRNYWWDSAGAHIASGTSTSGEISEISSVSSYGYNTLTGLTGISFRYNDAKVVDLNSTTPSLDFYQPPTISGNTVTQGKKTMMLSANALSFYDPTDGITEQAKLDTNGLILEKGGIKAGTAGQSGFIYLSTEDYPLKDEANNIEGLTINEWTPSVTGTREGQLSNDPAWRQIIGTKFGVDSEGNIYAAGGRIGGWHIGMDTNRSLYYENQIPGATTTNLVISSGSEVNTNSIAGSGTNENWFLSAGQKFGVTTDGTLYANNANIRGTIYVGNDVSSLDNAVRIGTNGIVLGNIRGFHIFMDAQDPNSNTYGLGFYETDHRPYVSTKDATIVQNKNYYQVGSDIRAYDLIDIDAYRAEHPEDLNPNPYSLGWYEEDTSNRDRRIAYINNNELSIPYTVVLKGMKLSEQWVWELNESTKNLTLKWVETEED